MTIPNHNRCMVFPEDIGYVTDFDGKHLTVTYDAGDRWHYHQTLVIYTGPEAA